MLTIQYIDGSFQVIRVHLQFFQAEIKRFGNKKVVISPEDKASSVALYLGQRGKRNYYAGFDLSLQDKTIAKRGHVVEKPKITKYSDKEDFKSAKEQFNNYLINKHSLDVKHGLIPNQIWKKYAQKAIIFGSQTQLL